MCITSMEWLLLPLLYIQHVGMGSVPGFSQGQGSGMGAPSAHVNYDPSVGLPSQPGTHTGRLPQSHGMQAPFPISMHKKEWLICINVIILCM